MIFQVGLVCKWTNDSQRVLLEHFDTIYNSPSHIYHSALPLSPSSSWLQRYYSAELPHVLKAVKGLPVEWGACSYTVLLNSQPETLSYHNSTIAVGCENKDIIILNAITGSQTGVLSGHSEGVGFLTFSSNGTLLVSASWGGRVKLWDIQTGGVIKTLYTGSVRSVSISADCTRIASRPGNGTIQLWDIQSGKCYHTIQQQNYMTFICFSPIDPQYLLSTSNEKVWQWDTNGHQIKPPFDGSYVSFSSDGTQLASWYKGVATIRNSGSGAVVAELQVTDKPVGHHCFSPDCKLVAGTVNNTAYVWEITTSGPHLVGALVGHTGPIDSCVFSSSSSLITISYGDKSIKVWKIGAPLTDPDVVDSESTLAPIQHIALQAKDNITMTSDSDGVVKIWDISTGICKASYQTPAKGTVPRDIQLIDGRLICVWYINGNIHMWDTEGGELWKAKNVSRYKVREIRILGDRSGIVCLDCSSVQTYFIQTGELMGEVEPSESSTFWESPVVDGSRVWAYGYSLGYQGWDFGISGPSPIQLHNIPPHKLHPIEWCFVVGYCSVQN